MVPRAREGVLGEKEETLLIDVTFLFRVIKMF